MIEGLLRDDPRGRGLALYSKEKQRYFYIEPNTKIVVCVGDEWVAAHVHFGQGSVCSLIVNGNQLKEGTEAKILD